VQRYDNILDCANIFGFFEYYADFTDGQSRHRAATEPPPSKKTHDRMTI